MNSAYECVGKRLFIKEDDDYSCYLILGVYKDEEEDNWYCFYHNGNSISNTNIDPSLESGYCVNFKGLDRFIFVNISDLKQFDNDMYIFSNE